MIDSLIPGLLFTLAAVALSVGGLVLVRRWLLPDELQAHHDITDPLSQVVGMMFAILLGFMVGDAMSRYAQARSTVQQEAASLADVFVLSAGLPETTKGKLQNLCLDYAQLVVDEEWPNLAKKTISLNTWLAFDNLAKACIEYEPKTQGQSNVQQSLLPAMVSLGDCRRQRVEALNNSLPAVLWCILLVGGLATVVFTYMFGAHNLKTQVIMVALVTLIICLNIFLLALYDDPFGGDIMVHPTAFQEDLRFFRSRLSPNADKQTNY